MAMIETSRGRIGADIVGSGGVPLLFLHGVGSDRSVWTEQLAYFGPTRTTIAVDHPGYGESDPDDGATRTDFALAALALLDALDIDRAHVAGLSLGGVIALEIHRLAPHRCASLILADSFARHPEGQAIYDRSLAGLATLGMRGLAEARVEALLAAPIAPHLWDAVIDTMAAIDPTAYRLAAAAVWLADLRDAAKAVECPALILCGSEDRVTPPALSEELRELIRPSSMIEIAGAGHLANLDRPEIFNRVVAAFLSDLD